MEGKLLNIANTIWGFVLNHPLGLLLFVIVLGLTLWWILRLD
jgi:hypothetical protein